LHGGSYQLSTPGIVYEPPLEARDSAATFRHDGRTTWGRGTYS
jgi:hypothetical protein